MMMRLRDGVLTVIDYSAAQETAMKRWGFMRRVRGADAYECDASMEALDRFAGMLRNEGKRLAAPMEAERRRLHRVQEAVDAERIRDDPEPLYDYPVKAEMYGHQVRAANMALLTFGIITPEEAEERRCGK